MLSSAFSFLTVIVVFAGAVAWAETKAAPALFKYLPAAVIIYLGTMLLASASFWEQTAEIGACAGAAKTHLLPVMIFLMLLRCDPRIIPRLGPRLLAGFAAASISIMLGFVCVYAAFRKWYEPDAWKSLAALCASWIGGTGNMVAVQQALDIPVSNMGYVLLTDSVNYALWVVFLLALTPLAPVFNGWTGSDMTVLHRLGMQLSAAGEQASDSAPAADLLLLLGTGMLVSALCMYFAGKMPVTEFITVPAWTVILATLAGSAAAMTPLSRIKGAAQLSSITLYILIAVIGSMADVSGLTRAPLYLISGFLIITVHAAVMLIAARLLKLDLFTCAVASLANIGGIASAPILAASYSRTLVPVGVFMSLLGYLTGTGGGLLVGKLLSLL